MSRSARIGLVLSVVCAVPAALAVLVACEVRAHKSGHIMVIDA